MGVHTCFSSTMSLPRELKSIQPFLQRAEEVKSADPVIAYWCTYYAAQLGIALKLKDNAARTFLFDLLGRLETMKSEIGPNDAIDDESASSAYVENFAIRVFAAADSEDRRGNATPATAKKFLAAANFLEVLNTFTQSSDATTTINVPEKIRYSKWKTVDITRAFREGRRPTPGAPGEAEEEQSPPEPTSPPAIHRSTPPPGPIADFPPPSPPVEASFGGPHQGFAGPEDGPMSPSAWSTVATPGTPEHPHPSMSPGAPPQSALRQAWVSEELEDGGDDEGGAGSPTSSGTKTVRFTPSVSGGLTPSVVQPPHEPFAAPSSPPHAPHDFFPTAPDFAPELPPPPSFVAPQPFVPPHVLHQAAPPPLPVLSYPPVQHPPVAQATITNPPGELSPREIAKVQKHCRFAISALDYEDQETARKELRAALAMLGG